MKTNEPFATISRRAVRRSAPLAIAFTLCATVAAAEVTPPTVQTDPAGSITPFEASLRSWVQPNGADSTAHFDYGLTIEYGSTTEEGTIPGWFPVPVPFDARITGLSCNTEYHFRVAAFNSAGTSYGSDRTFTTLACPPPVVTTGSASAITATSATLHGTANPNASPTIAKFEYGPTVSYGMTTPDQSLGSGTVSLPIGGGEITGLTCDTLYHFRAVASNAVGPASGDDATFRTFVCAVADFDGDGRTDRTVFRPSNGLWYTAYGAGGATATAWGLPDDVDVPGDYDGDGQTDIAMWRPSNGIWYIVQSGTGTVRTTGWGVSGDIPMAGDIDGDGKDDLLIYRPADVYGLTSTWFVSTSGGEIIMNGWGTRGDQPLLGDFDGDGKADLAVYRPGTSAWYIALSAGGTATHYWGSPGDVPLVGDWDSDRRSDCAIFRPSTGEWIVWGSGPVVMTLTWGVPGDVPLAGDWDGDGTADFTVWRPSNGGWYTLLSTGGAETTSWGLPDDRLVGRRPGS